MTDYSEFQPINIHCRGGLVLDKSPQDVPKGAATQLQNMEPEIEGGYKRLDGFSKYSTSTLTGSGAVLGIAFLGSSVIGCRGDNVEYGTGTTWTSITGARTSAGKYLFDNYNWTGTEILVMVSGQAGTNPAATWDGSSYVLLNGAIGAGSGTAPTNPTCVKEFRDHLFLGQDKTLHFTAPNDANDFTAGNGAGEITIPETIVNLAAFRDTLYVFAKNSIYKITGSDLSTFVMAPVSNNIGCTSAWSVQEIGGDVIFLAPDGLRTIAGTEKLDDVELGTISKAVQPRINDITSFDDVSSMVVRRKSQYRLWYPSSGVALPATMGLLGALIRQTTDNTPEQSIGWEWADLRGMRPSYASSGFLGTAETFLHGGWTDGIIYKQEQADEGDFDGTAIVARYQTPHYDFGDVGIRKTGQRLISTVAYTGNATITARVIYDYNISTTPQPATYTLTGFASTTYGTGVYGTDTYGTGLPIWNRQSIEGSGFVVAVRFEHSTANVKAFSIKSFQLEILPGGRR